MRKLTPKRVKSLIRQRNTQVRSKELPEYTGSGGEVLTVGPDGTTGWAMPTVSDSFVPSNPDNAYQITNIYMLATGELHIEYDDTPTSAASGITSSPTTGNFKVTNMYLNTNGELQIEYDDTPT